MLERKRKPGLGRYNGTRSEWTEAYRSARLARRAQEKPDPKTDGLAWKAQLIVWYERTERRYHSPAVNLHMMKLVREVIGA